MVTSRRLGILCILIPALASLLACSDKKPAANSDSLNAGIISNRPAGVVEDLYIITLESPPLLTVAKKTKAGWDVPAAAKEKILSEQALVEKQLLALAPQAKVIFRYRMTINGLAVFAPSDVAEKIQDMKGVRGVTAAHQMNRPEAILETVSAAPRVDDITSVNFIGADQVHKLGFTGKGMRIGILDTGIDYTHKMLGGSGKPEDYAGTDPAKPSTFFPNDKVVGGIDLVGTDFNASSAINANHLPKTDANPLDEAGHGSHVAGTIAGIGDGTNTYSGVAPDAQLYAIKVFGKTGSTMDAVVIAGFEFAADPNGDLNPDDQLDVVNLSLGGGYGQPQVLYTESVKNLSRAGTVVVASAGNSGPVDYIVGDPSTSDEAISVAASIDGSPINWKTPAVRFVTAKNPSLLVQAIEGPVSRPVMQSDGIGGELVDIGFGDTDLSDAVKAQLSGKVALVQRGKVAFLVKIKRAVDAGAIGVVVYNNDPTNPVPMGGEGSVDVPAVMVSQAIGMLLLEEMKTAPAKVEFKTGQSIEIPDVVDTITEFSSKGPRSGDNLLKPEIAAPGQNIISAAMGKGTAGTKMDGTSMAAPHMTGAIALIKQAHPDLSSAELKALAMNTAKPLSKKGSEIAMTLQGAGRVQILEAVTAEVISETASISLGQIQLEDIKIQSVKIYLRNLTDKDITLSLDTRTTPGMLIAVPSQVTVPARDRVPITLVFSIKLAMAQSFMAELDGRIYFKLGQKVLLQIPVLAIRTQASLITGEPAGDNYIFKNTSPVTGLAVAFNLLGEDAPKVQPGPRESWKNRDCDLQSAGYRVLRTVGSDGKLIEKAQFAFKTVSPVSTWNMCSISVLVDADGDGVADQEIAGVTGVPLDGVIRANFASALLDASIARAIRKTYETDLSAGKTDAPNYEPAVLAVSPLATFSQSTLIVTEAPLDKLMKSADGTINIKLVAQAEGGQTFEADDYLGDGEGAWMKIPGKVEDQPYFDMSELSMVTSGGGSLTLKRGTSKGKLIIYYPLNEMKAMGATDNQFQIFDN